VFLTDDELIAAYSHFISTNHESYFGQVVCEGTLDADLRYTGLHVAAATGLFHAASWLMEDNVNVNVRDSTGRTALIYASQRGDANIVNLLIIHGANVIISLRSERTALDEAVLGGHEPVVRLLLEHGADANSRPRQDKAALQVAVEGAHDAVVRALLEYGGDANASGADGKTVLEIAVMKRGEGIVRALLEHGADVNASGADNETMLEMAVRKRCEGIVRALLEHGADANASGADDKTVLKMAVWEGHEGIVRALLEHGADVQGKDTHPPLYLASYQGCKAIVKLLLDHGADVTPKAKGNSTALQVAARNGHKKSTTIASLLLEHGPAQKSSGHAALQRYSGVRSWSILPFSPLQPFIIPAPPEEVPAGIDVAERQWWKVSLGLEWVRDKLYYTHPGLLLGHAGDDVQAFLDASYSILKMGVSFDVLDTIRAVMIKLHLKTNRFPQQYIIKDVWRLDEQPKHSGGYDIYRALFQGTLVCLKIIKVKRVLNLKEILQGAFLLGLLSHPNLLPFYGFCRPGGQLWLVYPWAENGNVVEFLQSNPTANRVHLCSDIAGGVAHLHQYHIVHGDLKGENVLVDASCRAYLGNFGFSKVEDPSSRLESTGDTIRWQAPELFILDYNGRLLRKTRASDVYAWSCVCYQIFTDRIPYFEHRESDVIPKIKAGVRPTRHTALMENTVARGLTDFIWALMNDCWTHDPGDRPFMMETLLKLRAVQPKDHRVPGELQNHPDMQRQGPDDTDLSLVLDKLHAIVSRRIPWYNDLREPRARGFKIDDL